MIRFSMPYTTIFFILVCFKIFEIFHAKEITCGHQIMIEVTGERLNVLLVRMKSHRQGKVIKQSFFA